MRSPVPGLSASEGDKVSDSTPLLQDAPQAEAGEQPAIQALRTTTAVPGLGGQSTRALGLWGQSCLGRGSGGSLGSRGARALQGRGAR